MEFIHWILYAIPKSPDDLPTIITDELATTIVILGSGTEKSIDNLTNRYRARANLVAKFFCNPVPAQACHNLS